MRLPKGTTEIRGCNPHRTKYPCSEITEKIIGCAIAVHRELGAGFVEGIYENALLHEMARQGLNTEKQKSFPVFYKGFCVGQYRADMMVESRVVVELKAVSDLTDQHVSQLMSTMKAAGAKVGLLLNFHEARLVDGVRRIVM